jgi:hypothetical protein
MNDDIPMSECIPRRVYELSSRNLIVGVWDADTRGFIGIRKKFGATYLFTEFHWDTGPPFGTAMPIRVLDVELPDGIELSEDSKALFDFLQNVGNPH